MQRRRAAFSTKVLKFPQVCVCGGLTSQLARRAHDEGKGSVNVRRAAALLRHLPDYEFAQCVSSIAAPLQLSFYIWYQTEKLKYYTPAAAAASCSHAKQKASMTGVSRSFACCENKLCPADCKNRTPSSSGAMQPQNTSSPVAGAIR